MLEDLKISAGNQIMRAISNVAIACLKGKVPDTVLPYWTHAKNWDNLLLSANAWRDYCQSYGWKVSEYLLSDMIIDIVGTMEKQ